MRLGPPLALDNVAIHVSQQMSRGFWESAKVSHKRVFALLTPEIRGWRMAQMLQKPVFALPGCQQTSVNTRLCDTLGPAEFYSCIARVSC